MTMFDARSSIEMIDLWSSADSTAWAAALARYDEVIVAQGVNKLAEYDTWYRGPLMETVQARQPKFVTRDELARITEWKMARGVWRQRNLILVRSNEPSTVEEASREAFSRIPDPNYPIARLSKLAGVGPATASAVVAVAAPEVFPFFDELVGRQVPGLGLVDFNPKYYARYSEALRDRASQLGGTWTATTVERALWANSGGKIAQS